MCNATASNGGPFPSILRGFRGCFCTWDVAWKQNKQSLFIVLYTEFMKKWVQSNLALREIFVTAYLSLKVKFLLKSSFRNIISEPYISPTEKRKPFFPLSLLFPTAFNHNLNWFLIINFNQFWFYNQLNDTKHNLNWFHFNISHFIMNKH